MEWKKNCLNNSRTCYTCNNSKRKNLQWQNMIFCLINSHENRNKCSRFFELNEFREWVVWMNKYICLLNFFLEFFYDVLATATENVFVYSFSMLLLPDYLTDYDVMICFPFYNHSSQITKEFLCGSARVVKYFRMAQPKSARLTCENLCRFVFAFWRFLWVSIPFRKYT